LAEICCARRRIVRRLALILLHNLRLSRSYPHSFPHARSQAGGSSFDFFFLFSSNWVRHKARPPRSRGGGWQSESLPVPNMGPEPGDWWSRTPERYYLGATFRAGWPRLGCKFSKLFNSLLHLRHIGLTQKFREELVLSNWYLCLWSSNQIALTAAVAEAYRPKLAATSAWTHAQAAVWAALNSVGSLRTPTLIRPNNDRWENLKSKLSTALAADN
jgi:hypothetical protein